MPCHASGLKLNTFKDWDGWTTNIYSFIRPGNPSLAAGKYFLWAKTQ